MTTRVGINGFGRVGRNYLRALLSRDADLEVVAVNDLADPRTLAYLFDHDSVLGRYAGSVGHDDEAIVIDGRRVRVLQEREPAALPWSELGVEIVVESTGRFTDAADARQHIDGGGARKVLISAPGKGVDATIVMGVNESVYDPAGHDVVSNASCTTNCLAPLLKVFDEAFGIVGGLMTTVHAYTADQNLQDGPHRDPRRGRAAAINLVPTSTGAAKAIGDVLPRLAGRLDGFAIRVPVPTGSMTDLTLESATDVTIETIREAYREAAAGPLHGILSYTEDPLVSSDIVTDPHSAIFDAELVRVVGRMVKLTAWYDNEWGYSNRLVDLTEYVAARL